MCSWSCYLCVLVGLGGGVMSEAGLVSSTVVEGFDVVEKDGSHLGSGVGVDRPPDMNDFLFGCGPESFHRSVIETISGSSVGGDEPPVRQPVREFE